MEPPAKPYQGSALRVYARLRPRVGGKAFPDPAVRARGDTVETTTATGEHQHQKCFTFTKVFPEASSQEEVFEAAMRAPLDAFVEGKNVLLFAYGPTSGGKTHTMQGPPTDPGIVPRTLDRLFKLLGSQVSTGATVRPDRFEDVLALSPSEEAAVLSLKGELLGEKVARSVADFSTFHLPPGDSQDNSLFDSSSSDDSRCSMGQEVLVWLSFYEIYNEGLYDLLVPPSTPTPGKAAGGGRRTLLQLGEDRAKRSFVRGLVEVPVRNADEAHRLLCLARHNQSVAETSLNRSSSRSHGVFTVRLVRPLAGGRAWRVSTLMLCDLAGSERSSKTGAEGLRLHEAGRINTSLMVLSRCLVGLRQNGNAAASKSVPVPFRESKLTRVMQAFFTTGGHISLVVNICPALSMLEESLIALKFSAVACQVVPVQLETRREHCDRAVRRLTELRRRSSHGEERRDSNAAAVADADNAPLDEGDVEELFDTIEVLAEELAETQGKLKWSERMASAHEAKCKEYEEMVAALEQDMRASRENYDRLMAVRVEGACEITRMEMYRRAEAGSTMELLGRCEEAERRVAQLEKRLREQSIGQAPQQDLVAVHDRPAPVVANQGTQTDEIATEDSHDERSLAELNERTAAMEAAEAARTAELCRAKEEAETLRHSMEQLHEELAHETRARSRAEGELREASSRLANISQELAEQASLKEELERRFEDAQRLASEAHSRKLEELAYELGQRNREFEALRQQYEDKVEALRAAELRMERDKENHYRQLEEWRSETARDLKEAEAKVRDLEGDLGEKAGMVAALEEKCQALKVEAKEAHKSAQKAAEAQREAESRLNTAEQQLSVCRQELSASEEARLAASLQVEAKEEELSQLRSAYQSVSAEIKEQDKSEEPDENSQPRTRRTARTTRARKTRATSVASEAPGDDDFETPRRVTRKCKQSSAQPEGTPAVTPSQRSILGDSNAGLSPLQRFGDMLSGVLSRASKASEEARMAASLQVEAEGEEQSQLQSARQSTSVEIKEEDKSEEPDENSQPRARRTARTTRARKTRATSVASEAPGDDNFETPRRVTRSCKQSSAQPEGTPAITPDQRSILGDSNTGLSPLQRFGDMLSGVLSRASKASATPNEPSSRKRRPRK